MSATSRKTRPTRNNSLQKMLELERLFMVSNLNSSNSTGQQSRNSLADLGSELTSHFDGLQMERLQSSVTASSIKPANPRAVAPAAPMDGSLAKALFSIKPHRTDIQVHGDHRQSGARYPSKTAAGHPHPHPPLVLSNNNVAKPNQQALVKQNHNHNHNGTAKPEVSATDVQSPPERLSAKVVSFDIPAAKNEEDQRSICHSPSWEAWDRRKKDKSGVKPEPKKELTKDQKKLLKKELKDIKKEKDEMALKAKAREKEKEKEREREKGKEKEKEQEKEREKQEKQRNTLLKTKRLSKTPPMSSTHAIDYANRMSVALPSPSPTHSRPGSAMGRPPVPREDGSGSHRRSRSHSRSSSLSSLFRRPFEVRRNSMEESQAIVESGFIGGIKLEMERHAALQKALDEQVKNEKCDEADIHPALRTSRSSKSSDLDISVPLPGGSHKPADAQRRAYPPITRQTSTAKGRPGVSSTAATMPDAGTIDKWRSFVGMKPAVKQGAVEIAHEAVINAAAVERPSTAKSATSAKAPSSPRPALPSPSLSHDKDKPQPAFFSNQGQIQRFGAPEAQPVGKVNQRTMVQTSLPAPAFQGPKLLADLSLTAPLEPPVRNPNRSSTGSNTSLTNLGVPANKSPGCSSTSRFSASNASSKALGSNQYDSASGKSSLDSSGTGTGAHETDKPPAVPPKGPSQKPQEGLGQGLRMPTWSELRSTVAQAIASNVSLAGARKSESLLGDDSDFTVRRLTDGCAPTTTTTTTTTTRRSSGDTSLDEFHSASMPGTPDTSRPESEKGTPPFFSPDLTSRRDDARPQSRESRGPARDPRDASAGPVAQNKTQTQAKTTVFGATEPALMTVVNAATQVLHMPQGRAVAQIRVTSEAGVTQETSFLPKLKHQPLRPGASPSPSSRERMMAHQQPWPATYLEEARKATPLAPPPGLASPPLAPKANNNNNNNTPPHSVRSHSSSLNIACSGLASPSGDPVAKMFVECCSCKYFHDMPSNLYEAMANPEAVLPPRSSFSSSSSSNSNSNSGGGGGGGHAIHHGAHGQQDSNSVCSKIDLAGLITMKVRCPWCSHEMSTRCCAGYAAMVYLKQRLH